MLTLRPSSTSSRYSSSSGTARPSVGSAWPRPAGLFAGVALIVGVAACGSPPSDTVTPSGGAPTASTTTGGGGGTTGSGGAPVDAPDDLFDGLDPTTPYGACVLYVEEQCRRLTYCQLGSLPAPDELRCPDLVARCPDYLFSEGSPETPSTAAACAAEWRTFSCEDLDRALYPTCALRPGARGPGDSCAFHSQCDSRECSSRSGEECGICLPTAAPGATCSPYEPLTVSCPNGTVCDPSTGTCTEPASPSEPPVVLPATAQLGDACGVEAGVDCAAPHWCYRGSDDAPTCVASHAPGAPCTEHPLCSANERCIDGLCRPGGALGESCDGVGCADPVRHYCDENFRCASRKPSGAACLTEADCASGLGCLCGDGSTSCESRICAVRRAGGQSCAQAGEICLAGTACVAGVCEPTGSPQGLFAATCGL